MKNLLSNTTIHKVAIHPKQQHNNLGIKGFICSLQDYKCCLQEGGFCNEVVL